jgi:hypothetical protein
MKVRACHINVSGWQRARRASMMQAEGDGIRPLSRNLFWKDGG